MISLVPCHLPADVWRCAQEFRIAVAIPYPELAAVDEEDVKQKTRFEWSALHLLYIASTPISSFNECTVYIPSPLPACITLNNRVHAHLHQHRLKSTWAKKTGAGRGDAHCDAHCAHVHLLQRKPIFSQSQNLRGYRVTIAKEQCI